MTFEAGGRGVGEGMGHLTTTAVQGSFYPHLLEPFITHAKSHFILFSLIIKGISIYIYISMPKHQHDVFIYHNGIMRKKNIESMSKDEFMKLSKDEIYEIFHGQLAKQPAKRDEIQRQANQ